MASGSDQPRRIRVGVIFGGRSGEHEVSLRSAQSIMAALDPATYEVVPIGITRDGAWMLDGDPMAALASGQAAPGGATAILADASKQGLVTLRMGASDAVEPSGARRQSVDVVFPVLHGTYGEDGTIQGLLEMADVPYVGAGVLGSAIGMDKGVMKALLRAAGIPVVNWLVITAYDWQRRPEQSVVEVEARLDYPCFVKPANLGSSVGVSRADDEAGLRRAIALAAEYDRRVIVEQAALDCREVECSVLGNDEPEASVLGEIIPDRGWYDYDAKYANSQTQLVIPAQIPPETTAEMRRLAVETFRTLDCAGLARVDFFLGRETNQIWVNELNTIPGFTTISMYPKLWEASGLSYAALVDRLIKLAIERHAERARLRTDRG